MVLKGNITGTEVI